MDQKSTTTSKLVLYTILVAVTAIILTLGWFLRNSSRNFSSIVENDIEVLQLSSKILSLDEKLAMYVRLTVESNNLGWEKNYLETKAELKALVKIAKSKNQSSAPNKNKEVGFAQLVEKIETDIFDLVRLGDIETAREVINSSKYRKYKNAVRNEVAKINRVIIDETIKKAQKQQQLNLILQIILISGISGLAILFIMMRNVLNKQQQFNEVLNQKNQALRIAKEKTEKNEKYLQELNQTRDKLFSIITHDLNNPLSSILGFSNLLKDLVKEKDYTTVDQVAEYIGIASKRAVDLRTNLMEWSKSQTNKVKFNPTLTIVKPIADDVVKLMSLTAMQKNLVLKSEIDESVEAFIDKKMIETVIRNLTNNAIKYTKEGGSITIKAEEKPNECVISVTDTGIGIPENIISTLFKLGETKSLKGTSNEIGTGLGLVLCREFVEMNGGKIWVESEVGVGSSFIFTLPKRKKS